VPQFVTISGSLNIIMNNPEQSCDASRQHQQWMQTLFAAHQAQGKNNLRTSSSRCQPKGSLQQEVSAATVANANIGASASTSNQGPVPFNSQVPRMGAPGAMTPFNPAAILAAYAAQAPTIARQTPHAHNQATAAATILQQQTQPQLQQQQYPQLQQVAQIAALQSLLQSLKGQVQVQPQLAAQVANAMLRQGVQSNNNQGNLAAQQHILQLSAVANMARVGNPQVVQVNHAAVARNIQGQGPTMSANDNRSISVGGGSNSAPQQVVSLWNNNENVATASSASTFICGRSPVAPSAVHSGGPVEVEDAPQDSGFEVPRPMLPGSALIALGGEARPLNTSGPILVPCRSRTAPPGHNIKTGYLLIPDDASHGMDLLCSHNQCRNEGVKFLYCAVCQLPVAKRNFRKRHSHLDILLNQVTTKAMHAHPQAMMAKRCPISTCSAPALKGAPSSASKSRQNHGLERSSSDGSSAKPRAQSPQDNKDEDVTMKSSSSSGKLKTAQAQAKGSQQELHVSKTTPNGHSVSFSGSFSEPPSPLSNGDSNSNDSDLTTQATSFIAHKSKTSKTMVEVLNSYNASNSKKTNHHHKKRANGKKLLEHGASSAQAQASSREKMNAPSPPKGGRNGKEVAPTVQVSNDSGIAPPFSRYIGNSSEQLKNSGAVERTHMRRLLNDDNGNTAATTTSSDFSGAAVARQNQAAAEQAINVDAVTARMWEALLHERPSSDNVNDFRQWLLRCLSVSARFEGNMQHLSDSINASNSVHSCSARCSSVSSLSSVKSDSSIASSSDVAVKIRDGANVAGKGTDGGPLGRKGPPKKRFQQEPHLFVLSKGFHIDTPSSFGTDRGSGSVSSKTENNNKNKANTNNEAVAMVAASRGEFEQPLSGNHVVSMIEDARRKKHGKKRKKRPSVEEQQGINGGDRARVKSETEQFVAL
jgi:hypothetical protein